MPRSHAVIDPYVMARDAAAAGADKFLCEFVGFRESPYLWCLLHPRGYADAAVAVPAWGREQLRDTPAEAAPSVADLDRLLVDSPALHSHFIITPSSLHHRLIAASSSRHHRFITASSSLHRHIIFASSPLHCDRLRRAYRTSSRGGAATPCAYQRRGDDEVTRR